MTKPKKHLGLLNKRVFMQKLTALVIATGILVPLVHYRLQLPAGIYAGSLLGLHLVFLYLYFARTPWQLLLRSRTEFALRVTAVGFFIYILTLIRFEGSPGAIIVRLLAAMVVHGGILAGMMVVQKDPGVNARVF